MNILVCVKQIVDPDKIEYNSTTKTIKRSSQHLMNNPADLNALEFALRLKDIFPDSRVYTLSMGSLECKEKVKELIELGVDEAILLSDKRLAGSDASATSYALSCAIETLERFDLILCGDHSLDGETSIVPPQIAEYLGICHIASVVDIKPKDKDTLEIVKKVENILAKFEVKLPMLLSVKKDSNFVRFPKLSFMIRALSYEPKVLSLDDLRDIDVKRIGLEGSKTAVDDFEKEKMESISCKIYEQGSISEIECIAEVILKFI
ncbi:electron transfer flavoprotein subunit beta/FixA family protein [Caldicellulosiruptor naganoensis]|uniref:Electron transfer flavoprotein small subunit n=1 Tax=Caldicellulosiruptor naganoensis TaxID=29324 RepID=A0ABY7BD28_9FIRM|nr:electron transfer flavoprotein subunit beta/FixA family protein [Caldicellulosiruptor naganoensis]WAM30730.1 electron transfer flavoprotein subunit beta/FixA family protein [Caldicellulosiruptor naganoensis]